MSFFNARALPEAEFREFQMFDVNNIHPIYKGVVTAEQNALLGRIDSLLFKDEVPRHELESNVSSLKKALDAEQLRYTRLESNSVHLQGEVARKTSLTQAKGADAVARVTGRDKAELAGTLEDMARSKRCIDQLKADYESAKSSAESSASVAAVEHIRKITYPRTQAGDGTRRKYKLVAQEGLALLQQLQCATAAAENWDTIRAAMARKNIHPLTIDRWIGAPTIPGEPSYFNHAIPVIDVSEYAEDNCSYVALRLMKGKRTMVTDACGKISCVPRFAFNHFETCPTTALCIALAMEVGIDPFVYFGMPEDTVNPIVWLRTSSRVTWKTYPGEKVKSSKAYTTSKVGKYTVYGATVPVSDGFVCHSRCGDQYDDKLRQIYTLLDMKSPSGEWCVALLRSRNREQETALQTRLHDLVDTYLDRIRCDPVSQLRELVEKYRKMMCRTSYYQNVRFTMTPELKGYNAKVVGCVSVGKVAAARCVVGCVSDGVVTVSSFGEAEKLKLAQRQAYSHV